MPTTTHRTFHFSGLNTFKRILQFFFGVLLLEKCEVRSGNVTCVQKRAGPGPFVVQSRASPSVPQGGGGAGAFPHRPTLGEVDPPTRMRCRGSRRVPGGSGAPATCSTASSAGRTTSAASRPGRSQGPGSLCTGCPKDGDLSDAMGPSLKGQATYSPSFGEVSGRVELIFLLAPPPPHSPSPGNAPSESSKVVLIICL